MAVSYKKLWKLLIDKDIKKKDLSAKAGVSPATITKMGKGGHVTTEILLKSVQPLSAVWMISWRLFLTKATVWKKSGNYQGYSACERDF